MLNNRFIGWSGLVLFATAIALMLLLALYPFLEQYSILNPQAGVLVMAYWKMYWLLLA